MERRIKEGLKVLYGNKRLDKLFDEFLRKEGLFEHVIKKIKNYKRLPRKIKKQKKKDNSL